MRTPRSQLALSPSMYIDPRDASSPAGTDAVVSWWAISPATGPPPERALEEFVPGWLEGPWRCALCGGHRFRRVVVGHQPCHRHPTRASPRGVRPPLARGDLAI